MYKEYGLWALIERGFSEVKVRCLLRQYHALGHMLSTFAGLGVRKRIFYIDHFDPRNSNFYWLKAFRKFSKRVETFDIKWENRELLRSRIMHAKPDHIHLGGSVKGNMVSSLTLSEIKVKLDCAITVFYGDAVFSPHLLELADVADRIYVSNMSYIALAKKKGFENFSYMPCPTDATTFKRVSCPKIYDVIFVGNNNQPARLPLLRKLARHFDFKVFGNGWNTTNLRYGKAVYGKDFSKTCSRAKVCLSIIDPKWERLAGYFSNRLTNTLATGSFCIQHYTPGLEKVFTNGKHLVWYTDEEELVELIEYYLQNEEEREWVAIQGQKEVCEFYTYEKSVSRILDSRDAIRSDITLNSHWKTALAGEAASCGGKFTIEWFRKHLITIELFKSDVLHGEVLDVGCGIGTRAFLVQESSDARVTGIDASHYAIDLANYNFKSPNLHFVCGNALDLPFKNNTFDNAYMLAVIEHIVDTRTLLREIQRVVKPGGKLFLSVTEKDYHSDPAHVHAFTRHSLARVLKQYNILDIYVHGHVIFASARVVGSSGS